MDTTKQDQTPPADAPLPKTAVSFAVTPELLAALGVPAEQATPESVLAAAQSLSEKSGSADALTAQLATANAQLAAAQAQLAAAADDELAEQMSGYELDAPTAAAVKALPPEHRGAILTALPKKAAPAAAAVVAKPADIPPPAPIHDPNAEQKQTPEQRVAESEKLIKAVQAEGKLKDYTSAREEARRRQPALFA